MDRIFYFEDGANSKCGGTRYREWWRNQGYLDSLWRKHLKGWGEGKTVQFGQIKSEMPVKHVRIGQNR